MPEEPGLIYSFLLAFIYGTAFHLWKGRRLRDLPLYWLASVLGYAAGHVLGEMLDLVPWTLGQVHIIEATAGSLLFLVIIHWLTGEKSA
mgnify:FL=1